MLDEMERGHPKGKLIQRGKVPAPEDDGAEEKRGEWMHQRVRRSSKPAPAEERSRHRAPHRTGETAQQRQERLAEQEQCRPEALAYAWASAFSSGS